MNEEQNNPRSRFSPLIFVAIFLVVIIVLYITYASSPPSQYSNILENKNVISERSRLDYEDRINKCLKEKQDLIADMRKVKDELYNVKSILHAYTRATDTYLRSFWDLSDWLKNQSNIDLTHQIPPRPPPQDDLFNYTFVPPRPELLGQFASSIATVVKGYGAKIESEKTKCTNEKDRLTKELNFQQKRADDSAKLLKQNSEDIVSLHSQVADLEARLTNVTCSAIPSSSAQDPPPTTTVASPAQASSETP